MELDKGVNEVANGGEHTLGSVPKNRQNCWTLKNLPEVKPGGGALFSFSIRTNSKIEVGVVLGRRQPGYVIGEDRAKAGS